jgi:hypothetical protein
VGAQSGVAFSIPASAFTVISAGTYEASFQVGSFFTSGSLGIYVDGLPLSLLPGRVLADRREAIGDGFGLADGRENREQAGLLVL